MLDRFNTSNMSNSLIVELGGIQTHSPNDLLHINPNTSKNALDAYAKRQANFVYILQEGTLLSGGGTWAHAIAVKLNQSYTGGYLNLSYPCAMFDPNIGQGMYSNHTDLANDLCNVLYEYTQVKGNYIAIHSYLIRYDSGMD